MHQTRNEKNGHEHDQVIMKLWQGKEVCSLLGDSTDLGQMEIAVNSIIFTLGFKLRMWGRIN